MKTERFTVQTFGNEYPLTTEIEISKKLFNENLKMLRKQVKELEGDEEFYTEEYKTEHELERQFIYCYRFSNGTTDTYYKHYKCKEGYCFKNKRR